MENSIKIIKNLIIIITTQQLLLNSKLDDYTRAVLQVRIKAIKERLYKEYDLNI